MRRAQPFESVRPNSRGVNRIVVRGGPGVQNTHYRQDADAPINRQAVEVPRSKRNSSLEPLIKINSFNLAIELAFWRALGLGGCRLRTAVKNEIWKMCFASVLRYPFSE